MMTGRTRILILAGLFGGAVLARLFLPWGKESERASAGDVYVPRPPGELTFDKDVAPIIFNHCAECHRPEQSAPFALVSYADVKKRAKQIVEVTQSGFMPPWLPESDPDEFINQRTLTAEQLGIIEQWVAEGAVEGDPGDLPSLPKWEEGWQLGPPDVIATLPEPYTLPADGFDVYRNFVIPVPFDERAFVRTVEIRPGNPKVIHHAVMMIDRTPSSRELDAQDEEVGFGGGMSAGQARLPDGHFVGWTPGKTTPPGREGMAWLLTPGTDIVLQLHMRPTGKPETVQPSIGLYFADKKPALFPYALVLRNKDIHIPAGESDYRLTQSYTLPVDVMALSVYPHAHYTGKNLKGFATLPDGTRKRLIHIKSWDFNWQDDYRYREPIFLPKGTVIEMDYTYDNSAENPLNPNNPPKPIDYGQNTTDEMGELMLEVVPRTLRDWQTLRDDVALREINEDIERHQRELTAHPDEIIHHYHLGLRFMQKGDLTMAAEHYRQFVQAASSETKASDLALAYSDLATIALQQGNISEAIKQLSRSLPYWGQSSSTQNLTGALKALGDLTARAGRFSESLDYYQRANAAMPGDPRTLVALANLLMSAPDTSIRSPSQAVEYAGQAARATERRDPLVLQSLATALAMDGQMEPAIQTLEEAIALARAAEATELAHRLENQVEAYRKEMKPL